MSLLQLLHRLALAIDPATRRITAELRRVRGLIPPAERVLDLGSGEAPYAGLFPHRRYVSADLVAGADVRCDAATLPFARRSFDLVLCTEVLEHLSDPEDALREIRRVVTDTGTLVLATPLTWGVHADRDFHRWTDTGLRRLLDRAGFTVVQMRARGGILLCVAELLLVVPWQLFGGAAERRPWQTALFAVTYALVLPPALFLAALDPLDRRQHFTHGYVTLCRPAPR